jgi:hypothetical protein
MGRNPGVIDDAAIVQVAAVVLLDMTVFGPSLDLAWDDV